MLVPKLIDECTATKKNNNGGEGWVVVNKSGSVNSPGTTGLRVGRTPSPRVSSQHRTHPLERILYVQNEHGGWITLPAPYPYYITVDHSLFLITETQEEPWCVNIGSIGIKDFKEHLHRDLKRTVHNLFFCVLMLNVTYVGAKPHTSAVINYSFKDVLSVIDHFGIMRKLFGYGMNEKPFTISPQDFSAFEPQRLISPSIKIYNEFNAIRLHHQHDLNTVDFKFMSVTASENQAILWKIKNMGSILDYPVVVNLLDADLQRVLIKVDYRKTPGGTHFNSLKPYYQQRINQCKEFTNRNGATINSIKEGFYFEILPSPYYIPKEHGTHDKFVFEIRERLAKYPCCTTVSLQGDHNKLFLSLDEKLGEVKHELYFCPLLQHVAAKGAAETFASFNIGNPYGYSVFDIVKSLSIDMHGFYENYGSGNVNLLDQCESSCDARALQSKFSAFVNLPHPVEQAVVFRYLGQKTDTIFVGCTTGVDKQTFREQKNKIQALCAQSTSVNCNHCNPTCSFEFRV